MQLNALFTKVKLDYLPAQLDTPCERAAKRDLTHQGFLAEAPPCRGEGRHQKGVGSRLAQARFPWLKTLDRS